MHLYDNPASTNALKVRFLLAELDLDAELRPVTLHQPTPEYLAVHPFGLVPTLVDDGLVITESNTALRYLAERQGRDDLRGEDPAARARADVVLDSLSLEVRPTVWDVERIAVYGDPADEAEAARVRSRLIGALGAFDRLLSKDGPYALGPFTIADCAIAGRLLHLDQLGLDPGCAPRLRRTLAAARATDLGPLAGIAAAQAAYSLGVARPPLALRGPTSGPAEAAAPGPGFNRSDSVSQIPVAR
jgi:glutathione S-transferase